MTHFDNAAATWDQNPMHAEMSQSISKLIVEQIPVSKKWSVLDYGCGTGSLSFSLKDKFDSITLADESQEMIKVLKEKIAKHSITNMHPMHLNLLKDKYKSKHDLIYSQMALHHIEDINAILNKFYSILNPSGYLCIGDLVEEDGSFHSHIENYKGHNGFNIQSLKEKMEKVGFKSIYSNICYTIERKTETQTKNYPMFLMIVKR